MKKEPDVMSFEDWKKCHPEVVALEKEIIKECKECGGSGTVKCECCGSEVECVECNGKGKVTLIENSAFLVYEGQRKRDIKLWKSWACT